MMMKMLSCIAVFLIIGICEGKTAEWQEWLTVMDENNDFTLMVTAGNNDFAFRLYGELGKERKNLFFSPYNISIALGMISAGAEGNTGKQMKKVLGLVNSDEVAARGFGEIGKAIKRIEEEGDVKLHVANGIWVQDGMKLLDNFVDIIRNKYEARIEQVNFETNSDRIRIDVNKWVEEKTQRKIQNLLSPSVLNDLTRMVLVSSIYFKGLWSIQFEKFATQKDFFYGELRDSEVPMMRIDKAEFRYMEDEEVQMLEMEYRGRDMGMVVILPKEEIGLRKLEKGLTYQKVYGWLWKLKKEEVKVIMPKFCLEESFSLNHILKRMGMTDAFCEKADFSGITKDIPFGKYLYITEIIHKAFVDVDEEGTEAAAATAVVTGVGALPEKKPIIFRVDRPFIFLIQEHDFSSILFLGRVVDL